MTASDWAWGLVGLAVTLLIGWLREIGRWQGCDRHDWLTGTTKTRRWRRIYRTWWHRIRWHSLPGQQPFGATDEVIVRDADILLAHRQNRGRRWRRGVEMARAAVAAKNGRNGPSSQG